MKENVGFREKYITILFWIILLLILFIQTLPQVSTVLEAILFPICMLFSIYPLTRYLSDNLLLKAIKTKNVKRFIFQFIIISFLTGAIFILYLFLFSILEKNGVFPASEYFKIVTSSEILLIPISAGVIINLCLCGLRFFLEYIKSQKTIFEYQLRTLQHQVTPHFMFNVLNHIHILMQTDVELASSLLLQYSEILRYQLYNGDKEKVTIEQEVQFLKDFIAVEQLRWEDKLMVDCVWKIQDAQKEIPALLFITFIENAFKYVSKSPFEKGFVNINFEQIDNILCLKVENSKLDMQNRLSKSSKLGLKNAKERLNLLYPERHELLIKETDLLYSIKLKISL